MKKLLIILILVIFISGCISSITGKAIQTKLCEKTFSECKGQCGKIFSGPLCNKTCSYSYDKCLKNL